MSRAPFTWQGIRFTADPHEPGGWRSAVRALDADRTADWKVSTRTGCATFFARLRIGADRFAGRGETASQALEAAAAEAAFIMRLIEVMLPRAEARKARAAKVRKGMK